MNHYPTTKRAPRRQKRVIPDILGVILVSLSFYLVLHATRYIHTSTIFFITGLAAFSLTRQGHPYTRIATGARYICTFAPTAVILVLVAAAMSDFGSYLTRADFGMFYASALQLRTDPAHLYDITVQNEVLKSVTGGLEYHYLSFPYPPFVAALFVPLTYFSFRSAYYAMLGINAILFVTTTYLLSRSLCRTREQVLAVILAASVLLPIYINMILGHLAFVGMVLYALFAIDVINRKNTRAALSWSA